MNEPDFFIVGAPKCGTTAMYSYLRQHPEVFMPAVKEPHFFGSDLEVRQRISVEEYLSYFAGRGPYRRAGEASVWYLYSTRAAAEIKARFPNADIIIMLRNPVEMLPSLHSEMLYHGNEDIPDFEEAFNAEAERRLGQRLPVSAGWRNYGFSRKKLYYRDVAQFSEQVLRYLETFSREKVHVILFDDFRRSPLAAYRGVLHFLGVDESCELEFKIVNPNKTVRSRAVQAFLGNTPWPISWLARRLLPRRAKDHLYFGLKELNTSQVARRAISPEFRKCLQAEFRPEIDRLSHLLGRDLSSCYTS